MRCGQVQRLSTAYLDGDLDGERSSAIRGHLRGCSECSKLFDDELAIRSAVSDLDDTLDPPDSLWQRITDEVAAAEIRDARRSPIELAVRRVGSALAPYRLHLVVGAVAAVALLFLWVDGRRDAVVAGVDVELDGRRAVEVTSVAPPVFSASGAGANTTHTEQRIIEIHRADERYESTIAELREIAAGGRAGWPAPVAARYDREVSVFETRIAELRRDLDRRIASDPRRRDPLYQMYREHIAFLERAVWGTL